MLEGESLLEMFVRNDETRTLTWIKNGFAFGLNGGRWCVGFEAKCLPIYVQPDTRLCTNFS